MELSFYGLFLSILFFFHVSTLTHFNSSLQLRCHDDERLALLQFKQSFNWNRGNSSKEKEVTAGHGMVWNVTTKVIMSSPLTLVVVVSLAPSIPRALSSTHSLEILWFSSCNFNGQLPSSLGNLAMLTTLHLSNDNFSAALTSSLSWIGKLSHLISLALLNVELNGDFPPWLKNRTQLSDLDLVYNQLTGPISYWLMNITNLVDLYLDHNHFNGQIPSCLIYDASIEALYLSSNQLSAQKVEEFDVIIQQLMGAHQAIIPNFTNLGLDSCNLGNLPKLKVLSFRSNGFYGALKKVGTGHGYDLFPIFAYDNYDYSTIMNNKGLQLEYLKIPRTLVAIDVSCNKFEGAIANVIGNLIALHLLNLSNNMLIGHIPSSLANMKELECLDLSRNQPSGQVALQLSELTYLSSFNVSWNNLSGPPPQGKQFDTFDSC
ncbi:hypothetical protein GH714_022451 [Hevea brasiliensis]|uniref:Leucine-rich repeat-containing N-terminal plant-type domain-containing protein n=1 Tax=Hevea brasiliensis TaxID=3981 RepID=A0A6A6KWK6_HEVBR|nr:hypothetical protein GH714_022451 [Hevea brasiliensis]